WREGLGAALASPRAPSPRNCLLANCGGASRLPRLLADRRHVRPAKARGPCLCSKVTTEYLSSIELREQWLQNQMTGMPAFPLPLEAAINAPALERTNLSLLAGYPQGV